MEDFDDIVVDTNVLVHAANAANEHYDASVALLRAVIDSDTQLCFELGAAAVEAANRSRILSEYWEYVPSSSFPAIVLATLLQRGQWHCVVHQVPDGVRRCINQHVFDPTDRIFARVAHNSIEHVLVTHDGAAFPPGSCDVLRRHCGLTVLPAEQLVG